MADEKSIWQNQPTERSTVTLEKIRQRARELHAKTRRELFTNIAITALVVAVSGPGMVRAHDAGVRFAFALAIVWALAGQYFLHRGMWTTILPGDAGLSTGIEFYRRELQRRSSLFRRVLQWSFGPLVVAVGAFILMLTGIAKSSGLSANKVLPFSTVFAVWIVAFFVFRSRNRRVLQREIEELAGKDRE